MQKLIDYYGNQNAIACMLGVTRQAVSLWFANGQVSALQAIQIQTLTGGAISLADILNVKEL